MNFGENLKLLRKNSKISQEELAEKIGVSRQAVSRWEVGNAYPEMSNIVALCSIFKCNINDLINDNIVDVSKFDKDTQEDIVKFKKNQQKQMKGISKAIYVITKIVEVLLLIPTVGIVFMSIIFPFVSNTFDINENYITILDKKIDYKVDGNMLAINGQEHYVDTSSDIAEIIQTHDKNFFVITIEYVLICGGVLMFLIVLAMHFLSKLYKNIYQENTPFTIENERLVKLACMMFFIELILQKITALIYMIITKIDMSIDLNFKDVIVILVGISVIYIFKYGRMIQADTRAKIYD